MDKVRLGDVATLITKGTTPTTLGYDFVDKGINFVKIESITDDGEFIKDKFAYINEECNSKLSRSQLQENDILFSIAGAIGRVAIVKKDILPANTNQALAIIRIPKGVFDYSFLKYVFKSPIIYKQFEKQKQGVAQINLSLKNISDFEIPKITIERQKQISFILDKLTDLIDKRKKQLEKLDELVKSRFVEMFGDPVKNTQNWFTSKISTVAPICRYNGDMPKKVWLLNLDMVEAETGRIIDYLIVNKNDVSNSTCMFDESTVLYSKLRPYLNKVVIPNKCGYATSELIPLKPDANKLNKIYFAYVLRSSEFVKMISNKVAGAKMPRVSMVDFWNFDVPIPPIEFQNQFADFVAQTDNLKSEVQKGLEKLELLKNALMQKYFG